MLSRLGISSGVDRNNLLSFGQQYPPKYAGTAKSLKAGDKLSELQSILKWCAVSVSDGECKKIMKTL